MGYTTDFEGHFKVSPPLSEAHAEYLTAFSETRRMKRNADVVALRPDPLREAVGLPVGVDGEFYVGDTRDAGTDVIDGNSPPSTQPGLWCQWIPDPDDPSVIRWDYVEKFYEYIDWMNYLLEAFLKPWGYTVNGEVRWRGEDFNDMGVINVVDNVLITREATFGVN